MSYSPVATIDGIEFHPQASNVGIVESRDKFIETICNRHELSGTIWRRPERRQSYLDFFNNASGLRDLIDISGFGNDLIAKTNDFNDDIHYQGFSRSGISSTSIRDLSEFFSHIPQIKEDIDFAVRKLSVRGYENIVINVLNEFANSSRTKNDTHKFHIDKRPTYYIQIGGAGLEFTNAVRQCHMRPTIPVGFDEGEESTIRVAHANDENSVRPHEIGTLKPADFMYFRGWSGEINAALVHRAPHDDAVKHEGRLAISIYPA